MGLLLINFLSRRIFVASILKQIYQIKNEVDFGGSFGKGKENGKTG